MKKTLPVTIALAGLAMATTALYTQKPWQEAAPPPKIPVAERDKILREANAKLPLMIDEKTRLDKIDLSAEGFIYYYQFPTESAAAMPPDWQRDLTQSIQTGLCASPQTRPLLDADRSYTYHYTDNSGAEVFTLTVRKADCRPPATALARRRSTSPSSSSRHPPRAC